MKTTLCAMGVVWLSLSVTAAAGTEDQQAVEREAPGQGCQRLINDTEALIAKMPSGVEKVSARKELEAARHDLKKGEDTNCRTHIRNARDAVRSKPPA